MLEFFKFIFEIIAWVAVLGVPIGFVVPIPNTEPPINRLAWMVLMGVVCTPVVRPVVRRVWAWLKSAHAYANVVNKILPDSVESAQKAGIKTPLDFCVYMAAFQLVPVFYADRDPEFIAVTTGQMAVTANRVFIDMFGRKPLSGYDRDSLYFFVLRDLKTVVSVDEPRDLWNLCVHEEAARMTGMSPAEITFQTLLDTVSEEIKPLVATLKDTVVFTWKEKEINAKE